MKKLSRLPALAAVSALALGAVACADEEDDLNGSPEEQNDDDEDGELSNPDLEGGWVGDPEGEGHDDATVVIRENGFIVFAPTATMNLLISVISTKGNRLPSKASMTLMPRSMSGRSSTSARTTL